MTIYAYRNVPIEIDTEDYNKVIGIKWYAALAYNTTALKLFGEYARLNSIGGSDVHTTAGITNRGTV